MGYYMRGDYYRGDPFLGAIGAALGGVVGKLGGKAAKWVAGRIGGGAAKRTVTQTATGIATMGGGGLVGPILRDVALPALGGAALGGGITAVAKYVGGRGDDGKKRRRLNPLNPKALKRALRRAEGFEQFAKRTVNALYKTSSCGCSKKSRKFKRA